MSDQGHGRSVQRRRRSRAAAIAAAALLAGCSGDATDSVLGWSRAVRQGVGQLLRDDPPPPPRPTLELPPDEGRPYPNLASVPPKPPRVVPRLRDAAIESLDRDRTSAETRAAGLRGGADPGTAGPGGEVVGTVVADPIGAFSPDDERVLREAAALARQRGARIRLQGEARAALSAADRLGRHGIGRDRIDLVPAPAADATVRAVEIVVASDDTGR